MSSGTSVKQAVDDVENECARENKCLTTRVVTTPGIPRDAPMENGNRVVASYFVDSDNGDCKAMRHLHTGVILFVNKAPIL